MPPPHGSQNASNNQLEESKGVRDGDDGDDPGFC